MEKRKNKLERVFLCLLTDSIVFNLISDRKLTANDERTFLILVIYFRALDVSLAPGNYLLVIIIMALTSRQIVSGKEPLSCAGRCRTNL